MMNQASPSSSREGDGGPSGQTSRPVREGADRASTSPALRLAVGGLVAALFVCAVVVGKGLINTTHPSAANAASQANPTASAAQIESELQDGVKMLNTGQFAQAAGVLERVVDRSPSDQGARVAFAQALIGVKNYAKAYTQYEAAIAIAGPEATLPTPTPTTNGKGQHTLAVQRNPAGAALNFEAGTCAMMANLAERAEEHYSTAQSLDPGEPKYPLYLAMVQIKLGKDPAAIASLLRAVKLKPDLAEAWGTLAEVELKQNQTDLALQHIAQARKLQPDVTRWRLVEARGLNRIGDADKALTLLSALDPTSRLDPAVLSLMAESYGLLKKPADAAAMYADAVRAKPTDAELNYQAAAWYERAGDKGKARSFAKTAQMLGDAHAADMLSDLDQRQN